jgi:hypothetical protein
VSKKFDRDELIAAFDRIGEAAVAHGRSLEFVVYGGSALMLVSNFRLASEDVDISELEYPWPDWLVAVIAEIAAANGWSPDWLNDAVSFHLSATSTREADHLLVGSFPSASEVGGLKVYVPAPEYMLALKLKAARIFDPAKGPQEAADIVNLLRVLDIASPEAAIEILARYFPKTAEDPVKQLFLLRQIWNAEGVDAPHNAGRGQ